MRYRRFELSVADDDAGVVEIVCDDVPACVFFEGYPSPFYDSERETTIAWMIWEDGLLTRAVVDPPMTPLDVAAIGSAWRGRLLLKYLTEVGWRLPAMCTARAIAWPIRREPVSQLPPEAFHGSTVTMAREFGMRPSDVWRWPISEFLFSARLLGEAFEREREAHERHMQDLRSRRNHHG